MRISYEDMRQMRLAESQIMDGRQTKAGNFYLERKTLTGTNPVTGVKEFTSTLELAQPVIQVLKGDEHEIVAGMQVTAGDLICTFSQAKYIPRSVPSTVGDFYYDRVKYLGDYFQILQVWEKGIGDIPSRKVLFAAKEK